MKEPLEGKSSRYLEGEAGFLGVVTEEEDVMTRVQALVTGKHSWMLWGWEARNLGLGPCFLTLALGVS